MNIYVHLPHLFKEYFSLFFYRKSFILNYIFATLHIEITFLIDKSFDM